MNDSTFWAHPTAIVDQGAKIGAGTKIWHFSHVCGNEVQIGENCSLAQNVYVGPRVKIGRGCRIQNNVSVYDLVELEDYVFCGPAMVFTNVINPRAHIPRKDEFKRTLVRAGATLGANCTIVCGTTVGRFALIAAGAVVTKDVPEFAVMAGVPARRMGWVCHCGVGLKDTKTSGSVNCKSCGSSYTLENASTPNERLLPVELKGCFTQK